ncbi:EAL domain-containing protein [Solirubrobacter phytolaccae]|uniref:EAL domain-containing protein n=1 Tax=Solirubrobacter phytolaccae TaxID=1404360 RepID=A0A9X3N983_9ACTN|nr:EAL domain-containing protein [Solirubrobacter phytolaccae]MDA0180735.1 EAL domain-containing protein [Solirubrobacter phytolaccae]
MTSWIPRGRALPHEVWAARHRALLLVLAAHLIVLPAFAATRGWSLPAAWAFDVAPALSGALACVPRLSRTVRSSLCATALLCCSAVLVVAWHGTTEAHFHYFVMVGTLALYQQWWTFLLAIGFVVVQHGAFGAVHAETVFSHDHSPWKWAAIHGAFVAALAVAMLASWRESERVAEAEAASEERFRRAFDDAPVAIALVSPRGQVIQGNRELRERTGHVQPEGLLIWDFVPELDRVELAAAWPPAPDAPEQERRYVRADGTVGWFLWRSSLISDASGNPDHWILQGVDITARKQDAERLDHQAHHDALTELPNRARFDTVLKAALAPGRDVAVIFADLDNFKIINDSLGHRTGDELLVEVAERLAAELRPDDVLARFGGDEFVILLEGLDGIGEARRTANRLAAVLKEPFVLAGHQRFVSASFGIAVGNADAEALLRDADAAMYHAKEQGKARLEVFDESLRARAMARLEIEAGLREAMAAGELELHYQPKISLADGSLYGLESLLRWQHPVLGTISPATFIPIAEQSGLIVPIGEWVLNTACRQAAEWRSRGHEFVIAVNLSPVQLSSPSLARVVDDALRDSGLPPAALCLEITETAIMEDPEAARRVLQSLKALGVKLAIDDFGVGYSSLSKLKYLLPVDIIKIDKSFVDGITDCPDDRAIIAAIVSLAHELGATAVAEGVETEDQANALRALDCHVAQGYHFSRPLPAYRCFSQSEILSAASPALSPALRAPTPTSSKMPLNFSA